MSSRKRRRLFSLPASATALGSFLVPLVVGACADADAQFDVRYAPTFEKTGMTVSILGVFREGRMSPETWDDIGPRVSTAFPHEGSVCPIGYDSRFITDHESLADAIDDSTRANGITDELLQQLAPAAKGDAVLVITVAGRPVSPNKPDAGPGGPTSAPNAGGMNGNGMGRRGRTMGPGPTPMHYQTNVDRNAFEMTASLFSIKEQKSVASVQMGYSGQSGAEALQKFVAKLRESLPGDPCVGWKMETKIDEEKIKQISSE